MNARCIYCLESKPVVEFNTEHVLPKAFGGFRGALTFTQAVDPRVCERCNAALGSSVDLLFARDSVEAMLRLTLGLKTPDEAHELGKSRVSIQMPPRSLLGPVYLELALASDGSGVGLVLRPQVRFALKEGGYFCLTEDELRSTDPREVPGIDISKKDLLWSVQHVGARERLVALLAKYDLTFNPGDLFTPPSENFKFDVQVRVSFDLVLRRAVAKIGFNYLAKVTAAEYPSFVFGADFDPIRRFVRYGEGEMASFVRPMMPLQQDRSRHAGERTGRHHYLAATWDTDESADVLGTVVLFGERPYDVRLATRPKGVWIDLRHAHDYDLESMAVSSIPSGRLIRPVAGWRR